MGAQGCDSNPTGQFGLESHMEAASESNGVAALTPGKSPESAWNGTLRWERTDGQCNVCPAGGGSALWATAIRSALPFLL